MAAKKKSTTTTNTTSSKSTGKTQTKSQTKTQGKKKAPPAGNRSELDKNMTQLKGAPGVTRGSESQGTNIGEMSVVQGNYGYDPRFADLTNLGDYGDLNSPLARQERLADALEAQGRGEGPSVAQSQFDRNLEQNMNAARSMAASAQGGNRAAAQRAAIFANAIAQQQGARDAGELRAQEMLAAREQLAGVASDIRGQTLEQSAAAAGLAQADRQYNAEAANMAAQYNIGRRYDQAVYNANTLNARRLQQANLAAGIRQAGIGAGAQVRSAGIQAGAQMYASDNQTGLGFANLGAETQQNQFENRMAVRNQKDQRIATVANVAGTVAGSAVRPG